MSTYTYVALQQDLARLEADLPLIKRESPEDSWVEAFAAIADPIEQRAQAADLGHDAFIAINAMLIRHGLLDASQRIT